MINETDNLNIYDRSFTVKSNCLQQEIRAVR